MVSLFSIIFITGPLGIGNEFNQNILGFSTQVSIIIYFDVDSYSK
jgi:hypothetical protein